MAENACSSPGGRTAGEGRACSWCLAEVPRSIAVAGEGGDYVRYFCGLDCFAAWRCRDEAPGPAEDARLRP